MKILGGILIIVGILMMIFTGINFQKEKKLVDLGPVEINKKENKHIGWPVYVGALVTVAGIGCVIAGKNKK